jgi:hypothetical protein
MRVRVARRTEVDYVVTPSGKPEKYLDGLNATYVA